jgi:hypothetical protein
LNGLAGRLVFGNLATKGGRKLAAKLASRELGQAITRIALSKRTVRFIGKRWEEAFRHIAEHFAARTALATRAAAGVFLEAFRSRSAVEGLIKQAVKRPSNKLLSRRVVHGAKLAIGEPVVIVEREFSQVIGEAFKMSGSEIVKEGECKVLRVVFNVAGEVITAFPVPGINAGL